MSKGWNSVAAEAKVNDDARAQNLLPRQEFETRSDAWWQGSGLLQRMK